MNTESSVDLTVRNLCKLADVQGVGHRVPDELRSMAAREPKQRLTCWSCLHYTLAGCAAGLSGWPDARLSECIGASYEPGSDESEAKDAHA